MAEPRILTIATAKQLQSRLRGMGIEVAASLDVTELNAVEERFGFRFAADHRTFLGVGPPPFDVGLVAQPRQDE